MAHTQLIEDVCVSGRQIGHRVLAQDKTLKHWFMNDPSAHLLVRAERFEFGTTDRRDDHLLIYGVEINRRAVGIGLNPKWHQYEAERETHTDLPGTSLLNSYTTEPRAEQRGRFSGVCFSSPQRAIMVVEFAPFEVEAGAGGERTSYNSGEIPLALCSFGRHWTTARRAGLNWSHGGLECPSFGDFSF